jgi:hypothetical protein
MNAKGEPTGEYRWDGNVANRALELLGRELGLFTERSSQAVWDGDIKSVTDEQLAKLISTLRETAGPDDPADEDCHGDNTLPSAKEGDDTPTTDESTLLLS